MSKLDNATPYDVAILGTGIGGTILGAILARHGWRVLLIESGTHPRFAVGESVVTETAAMFRVLAGAFDVSEIHHLSTAFEVRRYVTSNCGVKRAFSYVYQRMGERQRPHEITQFPTLAPPYGPDSHFFRQDTDAYMLAVAARYGAEVRQKVERFRLSHMASLNAIYRHGENFLRGSRKPLNGFLLLPPFSTGLKRC